MSKTETQKNETVNTEKHQVAAKSNKKIVGVPFVKGDSRINRDGLNKKTEEQKIQKEARKIAIERQVEEHIEKLGNALPQITPALIKKAESGDVPAIKEIHSVLPIEKETSKHEHIIKGAILHGHFYPEDEQVEEDLNKKYKENYRARIKQLPKKEI